MSHVSTMQIGLRGPADARLLCQEATVASTTGARWELVEGQTQYQWYGRWLEDQPVPRHLFDQQADYDRVCALPAAARSAYLERCLGRCQHVLRVTYGPGYTAEIGLVQVGTHLVPAYDPLYFREGSGISRELAWAHARAQGKAEARRTGRRYAEALDQTDNSLVVTLTRTARY